MKVILFVDDENLVVNGLRKIFDDKENKYVFKQSGLDALEYMRNNPVDLLCTDIVMPEFDGFDLLRAVKKEFPKTVRIALTSMTRSPIIKKLMNENLAQIYIFKPWNDLEIKRTILKILNMQTALYSSETMNMLHKLESIPTIPKIYNKLSEMVINDEPIESIAGLIEEDQSITSVILRVANSAFYGRKTGNIPQAIMNIGLDNLKSIVLANAVFQELTDDMGMLLDMWQHATNTNKLMTAIYAQCLNKPMPSLFASAGLLHDIGKVVLYHNYDEYRSILDRRKDEGGSIIELEIEELGVGHQDLGAYLLNIWDLPYAYVEAAMFHHRPLDHRIINRELVSVAHLAHYYATKYILEDDGIELDKKAFALLKIDELAVEELITHELGWRLYD